MPLTVEVVVDAGKEGSHGQDYTVACWSATLLRHRQWLRGEDQSIWSQPLTNDSGVVKYMASFGHL